MKTPVSPAPSWLSRPSGRWMALLIALCLGIPCVWSVNRPSAAGVVFISTCLSICAATGLWLGFTFSIRRAALAGLICVCLASNIQIAMDRRFFDDDLMAWLFLNCIVVAVVTAPIAAARAFWSGELQQGDSDQEAAREVFQFGISHLLGLTTVAAILMALLKWLIPEFSQSDASKWMLILKLGITLGICPVMIIWSTVGQEALFRTLASAGVTGGLGMLNARVTSPHNDWIWLYVTLIVWGQVTVLMWLIRHEGYRFVSHAERIS